MTTVKKSTRPISETEISRIWHLIDAKDQILGRCAPEIATLLQGKNKRSHVPYLDIGDNVIVVNADLIKVTGKKNTQKIYDRYSGYQGGRKTLTYKEMMIKDPTKVIREAVSGMLPKNKLRDPRLSRLHIYKGAEHPFSHKLKLDK